MRRIFRCSLLPQSAGVLCRWQSSWGGSSKGSSNIVDGDEDEDLLQRELQQSIGTAPSDAAPESEWLLGGEKGQKRAQSAPTDFAEAQKTIRLEKLSRPPAKFDLLTNTLAYKWTTTAANARKVSGPMSEWSGELKYRTGVHIDVEPTFPDKLSEYATPDEVDVTVYLFGGEKAVQQCQNLMYAALQQDPSYVRLAVFRRIPNTKNVEWLMLRRVNRELRPPDIPPISLKTPGKYTMMYEQTKEAAVRTLWEETGIRVLPKDVYPTKYLFNLSPLFYWRVPVQYFVAEVPFDVNVLGPQSTTTTYIQGWDSRLFANSPDPIDRAWAQYANPETGCGWLPSPIIDELQKPLRGENYMKLRYTPPPYSNLQDVVGFVEAPPLAGSVTPEADFEKQPPVEGSASAPSSSSSSN